MRLKKLLVFLTLILPFFFMVSCSSDESNPAENDPPEENMPEVTVQKFDVPERLQSAADTSFGASQALAMLEMVNSFQELFDEMIPPDAAKIMKVSSVNGSRTYFVVVDGVTMTWDSYWDDSTMELTLTYDGTRGSDGTTFSNFEKGFLWILMDGSYFTYTVHDDFGGRDVLDIEMERNSIGDYHITYDLMGIVSNTMLITANGTMVMSFNSSGMSIDMKVYPDGSGEYDIFDADGNWIEHGTW